MHEDSVVFHTVPIQPMERLKEAKQLIGDQYWLFVGICAVGFIIASAVPMGILMGPMFCGMYLCFLQRMRGKQVAFDTLFRGFDYFVESLIATLIMVGISLVVILPLFVVMMIVAATLMAGTQGGQGSDMGLFLVMLMMGSSYVVILLFSIVIGTLFMFAYPLIVDMEMKALPALKVSFRAAKANFAGLLGLVLLNTLLSIIAAIFCYVPVFFLLPILIGAIAVTYRAIFPSQAVPTAELA